MSWYSSCISFRRMLCNAVAAMQWALNALRLWCPMTEIKFSENLISVIGHQSLNAFRAHCMAATALQSILRNEMQELYHDIDFADWRQTHFKTFLKEKRKEEKDKKLYTRPY